MWSLGATVNKDGRDKFDAYLRDLMGGKMEEHEIPAVVGKIDTPIPPEGLVYDYLFEVQTDMQCSGHFARTQALPQRMRLSGAGC